MNYLQSHAQKVLKSSKIVIIGGGAVGVQIATDLKELYPEKAVTLVHSRQYVMNQFDSGLHEIVEQRCRELGINLRLGSRVRVPSEGYPADGRPFNVVLEDGSSIPADLAVMQSNPGCRRVLTCPVTQIVCTGQTPQSDILRSLSPESIDNKGFIRTLKTLQIDDKRYPNVFAIGDVADTGAHKAARP